MVVTSTDLHPAIEAVVSEEAQWRAIGFHELSVNGREAIRDVGRIADLGYYYRELPGTSDPDFIPELASVELTAIEPGRALELRSDFDLHWRKRPEIAEGLGKLWVAGFFDETTEGALTGQQSLDVGNYPGQECAVVAEADGTVAVRLDRNTIYEDSGRKVDWHEYRMPRGTYLAEHKVQLKDVSPQQGGRIRREIINSFQVPYQINLWVGRVLKAVTAES